MNYRQVFAMEDLSQVAALVPYFNLNPTQCPPLNYLQIIEANFRLEKHRSPGKTNLLILPGFS